MSSERAGVLTPILLGLTVVTGLVDAVSYLALGHVFTANMTGNIVLLGFDAGGAPGLSLSWVRSSAALAAFLLGAVIGGRIALSIGAGPLGRPTSIAFGAEAVLLFAAMAVAAGAGRNLSEDPGRLYAIIVLTGLAMGLRNAVVRKLAVPDLTTTVLTMTITGLGADSPLAGGEGPRWQRRVASVALVLGGAAAGAWLVARSVALALGAAGMLSALCAGVAHRTLRPEAGDTSRDLARSA